MSNPTKKVILDISTGNIVDKYSNDKAILVGVYPNKDSSYSENLELILNHENSEPISLELPYSGYNMQLFVGDFTGDNKSEIMVRGGFGGSGGFEIGAIYKYEDKKLVEIFNQETITKNSSCVASFKDNYKVHVTCGKKKYSIDISSKPKEYLDFIYDSNQKVKSENDIYVDAPNGIYPIKQIYENAYQLLIQQRIVGISNADTLGVIQTLGSLIDSKFDVIYKGLLLQPEETSRKTSLKKQKNKPNSPRINKAIQNKLIENNELIRDQIYYGNEFNVQKDNIDLIVNSINEDRDTLYLDTYIVNLTNRPISRIDNFKLQLIDANKRLFAEKTFPSLDIQGSLKPYQGKRMFLSFFKNEYGLFDANTNNITWNYTYDAR